jgi:hypothetical protein
VTLDCYQEVLSLVQCQTQLLRQVARLVEHNQFIDRHLLIIVIIGDHHELKLEPQRHLEHPATEGFRHGIYR